ncbi:MAG: FKBP-type peptidyl-prolyl cis-trans isomerase, partial [Bacteroidota bacterium]
MKKIILTLILGISLMGCRKDSNPDGVLTFQDQLEIDIEIIENYLSENGITATKDETGVFYVIDEPGTGSEFPNISSQVSIAYTGKFLDGTVFDSADPVSPLKIFLSQTINGWQIGIPKFKREGKGTLYIPSGYGYGAFGTGGIPGNAILVFDIELLNIN